MQEIVAHKFKEAFSVVKSPVLAEDVSLGFMHWAVCPDHTLSGLSKMPEQLRVVRCWVAFRMGRRYDNVYVWAIMMGQRCNFLQVR